MAKAVVNSGALDALVNCLEEFDPSVKEAAALALSCIAKHNHELAQAVVDAGAVGLLVLCVQEPELTLKRISATALGEIAKHTEELAQAVGRAGLRLVGGAQRGKGAVLDRRDRAVAQRELLHLAATCERLPEHLSWRANQCNLAAKNASLGGDEERFRLRTLQARGFFEQAAEASETPKQQGVYLISANNMMRKLDVTVAIAEYKRLLSLPTMAFCFASQSLFPPALETLHQPATYHHLQVPQPESFETSPNLDPNPTPAPARDVLLPRMPAGQLASPPQGECPRAPRPDARAPCVRRAIGAREAQRGALGVAGGFPGVRFLTLLPTRTKPTRERGALERQLLKDRAASRVEKAAI